MSHIINTTMLLGTRGYYRDMFNISRTYNIHRCRKCKGEGCYECHNAGMKRIPIEQCEPRLLDYSSITVDGCESRVIPSYVTLREITHSYRIALMYAHWGSVVHINEEDCNPLYDIFKACHTYIPVENIGIDLSLQEIVKGNDEECYEPGTVVWIPGEPRTRSAKVKCEVCSDEHWDNRDICTNCWGSKYVIYHRVQYNPPTSTTVRAVHIYRHTDGKYRIELDLNNPISESRRNLGIFKTYDEALQKSESVANDINKSRMHFAKYGKE
jgi:hypothetical protein